MSDAQVAVRTRLRPTPAGAVLLPITLACLAVALIYGGTATLLAAASSSLLAVSMLTAWLHVRGLELESPPPIERAVGTGFSLHLRTRSLSSVLPACAVTVRTGQAAGKSGALPFLAPGAETVVELPHRFSTRGLRESLAVQLVSAFPFGLIRCERDFELPGHFLGLPRPIEPEDARRLASFERDGTQALLTRFAGEDELWGPRDWREGETLRRVHWKLSAKRARLVVSEFRRHEDGPLNVILVTHMAELRAGEGSRSFERAVSVAAALCERALRDRREVTLRLLDSPHSPGLRDGTGGSLRGRVGRITALRALARVEPSRGDPLESATKEAKLALANGQSAVCVLASGGSKHAAGPPRNSRVRWFDVDSRPSPAGKLR